MQVLIYPGMESACSSVLIEESSFMAEALNMSQSVHAKQSCRMFSVSEAHTLLVLLCVEPSLVFGCRQDRGIQRYYQPKWRLAAALYVECLYFV